MAPSSRGREEGVGEVQGDGGGGQREVTLLLPSRVRSSLEAVEDLALHAMLDLAPPQHELQDLVDGVLRVLLQTEERMQEHAPQGHPGHPCLSPHVPLPRKLSCPTCSDQKGSAS